MATKKNAERYVMVTTEHRGVFAGYTSDTSGDIIALRAARNCIYWSSDVKGFLGLASGGPSKAATTSTGRLSAKYSGKRSNDPPSGNVLIFGETIGRAHMSPFVDRRTKWQLESYRHVEQERADLALEKLWRDRVRENVRRRMEQKWRQAS